MLGVFLAAALTAQTTQSVIRGRVIDSSTGKSIAGARVVYYNPALNGWGKTDTDLSGAYTLESLSPGQYRIRIEKEGYQSRDVYSLDLHVASRLELNADLRRLGEVLNATPGGFVLRNREAVLPELGPDLELGRSAVLDLPAWKSSTLQSALSYVIDPQQTGELPLAARNVYTMIVTLPGVTAEEATGRGLGISANGQRSSSSNFLLDGAENNDYLLTGPFSAVAPEGMQEYRITTNNFSAEYGGTGGFVANAVTRSGSNTFHGLVYTYLNNDVLNASTFQQNAFGIRRTPQKQLEAGYWFGGPIIKDRLFFSSGFDRYRSRALGDPQAFVVPVVARFQACAQQPGSGDLSRALSLLSQFPPPAAYLQDRLPPGGSPCLALRGNTQFAPQVSLDRSTAVERLDYRSRSGVDRLMGRLAISRLDQPNQQYSVYSAFDAAMTRDTSRVTLSYLRPLVSGLMNEANFSWRNAGFNFERPLENLPILTVGGIPAYAFLPPGLELPYNFTENEHDWAFGDSVTVTHGPHMIVFGASALLRRERIRFPLLPAPIYIFGNRGLIGSDFAKGDVAGAVGAIEQGTYDFALSRPTEVLMAISREALQEGNLSTADPRRSYSDNQFSGFVQDAWKVGSRLTINLGLRYESFGTLRNTGAPDGIVDLPSGADFQRRLAGAGNFIFPENHAAFSPDRKDWAGRFGVSYGISSRTIVRAGYGLFYDRLYDNLFLNPANSENPVLFCPGFVQGACQPTTVDYTQPLFSAASKLALRAKDAFGTPPLLVDPGLRTPYVQSWFAGVQQQFRDRWYFEISQMGSLGRRLVTTDLVNQAQSGNSARLNPALPALWYRSNSGSSDYTALGATVRYQSAHADFQASYSWSHSIDNQSDAMIGDPFSLTRFNPENAGSGQSATQFNSRADRGSSDFDIRHNFVFYSIWYVPRLHSGWMRRFTSGWQVAQLADFRTGLPYTVVYSENSPDAAIQNRPDVVPGINPVMHNDVRGGVKLLNSKAFSAPSANNTGSLGRNTFTGPGFWNFDLSLAKSFSPPHLGESRRIQFRADAFNLFNHSNLSQPNTDLTSPIFGQAQFGSTSNAAAFPTLTPLYSSPRRIQVQLKLYF
jgi:hypothetical protein